jgi:hypothetical protein
LEKEDTARSSTYNLSICILECPEDHTSWEVGSGLHIELKFPGQYRVFVRG